MRVEGYSTRTVPAAREGETGHEDVEVMAFIVNSHTGPFDLSRMPAYLKDRATGKMYKAEVAPADSAAAGIVITIQVDCTGPWYNSKCTVTVTLSV